MRKFVWCVAAIVVLIGSVSIAHTTTAESVPRFLNDIAPILDKNGCSTALCHGKFGGQGGFDLSLLTLNPESDHQPIVYNSRGRRVNLIEPERSLFLLKPTEQVSHEGGMRFTLNSDEYLTILRWLEAGAPFSPSDPRLERLETRLGEFILPKVGDMQQLQVLAYFTNGSIEDVTHKAVYESSDEPIAEVTEGGLVTSVRWGGTAILARFLGVVSATFLTIPRDSQIDVYPEFPANNFIDEFVTAKLKKLNILPSELSTDEEFIRRVYLDTIGQLPSPNEVKAFVENSDVNKRTVLISAHYGSPTCCVVILANWVTAYSVNGGRRFSMSGFGTASCRISFMINLFERLLPRGAAPIRRARQTTTVSRAVPTVVLKQPHKPSWVFV